MKLIILLAIIQLSFSTFFTVSNKFSCPGRRFKVEVSVWEYDTGRNSDDDWIPTIKGVFDNNGEIISKGTFEKDHRTDEEEFNLYAWYWHNCTVDGERDCIIKFISRSDPNVEEMAINYSVNLADNNWKSCHYFYEHLIDRSDD